MTLSNEELLSAVDTVLENHNERIAALEAKDGAISFLSDIASHLRMMALCAMEQSGLARVEADAEGNFVPRLPTPEERESRHSSPIRYTLGKTSTLMGDGAPQTWVLQPPAPYNDVELVCAPDGEAAVGMRCTAARKSRGGETMRFTVTFEKES